MADYSPPAAWTQYWGARLAASALLAADADTGLAMAKTIAKHLYPLFTRHAGRTREHIAAAFPDWPESKVEATTRQAFEHLAMLGVEMVHTPRAVTPASWERHVSVEGLSPNAIALLSSRRPAILVTGHIGNWEMLGYSLAVLGYPIHAIARPLDNPLINQWVFGIRERRGIRLLDKERASFRARELLDRGESVGFIADQNAGPKGCFVPFMGRLASTHKSVALLALSYGAPIVCGAAIRQPKDADGTRFHHRLETTDIIHPEEWAAHEDPVFYVTARWAHAVEQSVMAHPGQYLWMHRRWRTRPKFEVEGKPMPAALRRKLESLPWMTQEKMARLDGPSHAAP